MDLTWSVAKHDSIPLVELSLLPLESHAYLFAFLRSEGTEYVPPYQGVRDSLGDIISDAAARRRPAQAPSADVSNERLRTWKAVFESFGILRVDTVEKRLQLTPLGRAIKDVYATVENKIEGSNDRLAMLATKVLARHRLRNPLNGGDYPLDSDVHPYRLIWKAMRQLDNKIHWEEINRVLMRVLYSRDEGSAIEQIRIGRRLAHDGAYDAPALAALGAPVVEDGAETQRRISPWLSQAGFGGYLISPGNDTLGYRHLVDKYIPLVDDALANIDDFPDAARTRAEAYLAYITADPSISEMSQQPEAQQLIDQVVDAVGRFGATKIVCLAGLPGTGKTYLSRRAALQIVDNDPYRLMEIQFHPGTGYEDFVEGFVPKPSGEGFELAPKVLRTINRRARLDPEGKPYVLLIEEFTRANVLAVLGEILTYIEHRDRPFRFAISNQEDRLAPNLVILATMNPRDKTALTLDHAALRRLHRIIVPSSVALLRELLSNELDPSLLEPLELWFERFKDLLPFGHAVFAGAKSQSDLSSIWAGTLLPFLLDISGDLREQYREAATAYPWPDKA